MKGSVFPLSLLSHASMNSQKRSFHSLDSNSLWITIQFTKRIMKLSRTYNLRNHHGIVDDKLTNIPGFEEEWGTRPFGPKGNLYILGSLGLCRNRVATNYYANGDYNQYLEARSDSGLHCLKLSFQWQYVLISWSRMHKCRHSPKNPPIKDMNFNRRFLWWFF